METPNTQNGLTSVRYISSWNAGDPPEDISAEQMIERLFVMMDEFLLDPTFERYGNFMERNPQLIKGGYGDYVHLFGNFYDYSFVFNIETKDEELVARFAKSVEVNQAKPAYKEAKAIRERQEKERALYFKNGCKTLDRVHFEREMDNPGSP